MSKTKHPDEFIAGLNQPLDGGHFMMTANPHRNDAQASMTYMVNATGGTALGVNGGTLGFGKEIQKGLEVAKGLYGNNADTSIKDGDMALLTRQVASYRADQFLGLNSVAEERYGMTAQGKVIGISMQVPGCNVENKNGLLAINYSDPRIQRGLSDLQVSDYITGQRDRHAGNIFIEPTTGQVTGIDNDLAFGNQTLDKTYGEATQKMVLSMPHYMHEETKAKIMTADPEALRKLLSTAPPEHTIPNAGNEPGDRGPSPLPTRAVDNAVNRLIALQRELASPTCSIKVVSKFDDATYAEELELQEEAFKKEVAFQQKQASYGKNPPKFDPPKGFREYAALDENAKAGIHETSIASYVTAPRTSYLGTVEMAVAKNRACAPNLQLPEHGNALPMQLAPEDVRTQVMLERKLADAYVRMTSAEKKAFDLQFKKLGEMEEKVAVKENHLVHPGLADRLNAFAKGVEKLSFARGEAAVKDRKQHHIEDLHEQISELKSALEKTAEKKLGYLQTEHLSVSTTGSSGSPLVSATDSEDLARHVAPLGNRDADNSRDTDDVRVKPVLQKHESVRDAMKREAGAHEHHEGNALEKGHTHVGDVVKATPKTEKHDETSVHQHVG